jgi:hypothetical protein
MVAGFFSISRDSVTIGFGRVTCAPSTRVILEQRVGLVARWNGNHRKAEAERVEGDDVAEYGFFPDKWSVRHFGNDLPGGANWFRKEVEASGFRERLVVKENAQPLERRILEGCQAAIAVHRVARRHDSAQDLQHPAFKVVSIEENKGLGLGMHASCHGSEQVLEEPSRDVVETRERCVVSVAKNLAFKVGGSD